MKPPHHTIDRLSINLKLANVGSCDHSGVSVDTGEEPGLHAGGDGDGRGAVSLLLQHVQHPHRLAALHTRGAAVVSTSTRAANN